MCKFFFKSPGMKLAMSSGIPEGFFFSQNSFNITLDIYPGFFPVVSLENFPFFPGVAQEDIPRIFRGFYQ